MRKQVNQAVVGSRIALTVGVVAMLAVLVVAVLPRPTNKGLKSKFERDRLKTLVGTKLAREERDKLEKRVDSRVWIDDQGEVAGAALAKIDQLVRANRLQLVNLRPQRLNENGALKQLPFVIIVDGSFTGIVNFTRELEKPENKLAVNLLQFSSADSSSDQVTATLNLLAYLDPNKPKKRKGEPAKNEKPGELKVSTNVSPLKNTSPAANAIPKSSSQPAQSGSEVRN